MLCKSPAIIFKFSYADLYGLLWLKINYYQENYNDDDLQVHGLNDFSGFMANQDNFPDTQSP